MGRHAHGGRKETHGAPPAALRAESGCALSATLACRSLLAGAIDYAGLFPPASLSMADAVAEYAQHRKAPDNWALGRFVVPLSRLTELETTLRERSGPEGRWPISLLASPADAGAIRDIESDESRVVVESVESRANSVHDAAQAAALVSPGVEVFVEITARTGLDVITGALARIGAAAKIRTGGVTADAFPDSRHVLAFFRACRTARIRFKATAGLHHAVRGEYRLTYDPVPPTGIMFGFLNVAIAAALHWLGRRDAIVLQALDERSADAFAFTDDAVTWRGERLTRPELEAVRAGFFSGFGSCSFREPMAELGLEAAPRA